MGDSFSRGEDGETTETLRRDLLEAHKEILDLRVRTRTTLSGMQFLTIVLIAPLFLAFVTLGVLIVWKTTSSPATVAPHLDIILVAFAIFANPVTAATGVIVGLMADELKGKKRGNEET